jgi:HK97 family phage major capsid protein
MKKLQELRGRRDTVATEARELHKAHADKPWTKESGEKYDALISEISAIDTDIAREQKYLDTLADQQVQAAGQEAVEKRVRNAGRELFAKWLVGGDKALTAQDWADIRNTMSTTTTTEGGHTVPTEVYGQVLDVLKAYGGVREAASVIQTSMGNDMNFPTSDGTSETGELIAQNTTATGADPTFGVVTLAAYKFSSKIVAVPFELLQDSAVDIEAFIARRLGERLGRVTNTFYTTGTGTSQPKGVVTASTAGKTGTTGQTTSVIFDDLVDLVHSVDPAYRVGGCRWMMNDASLKNVRKLKDSQNRPIFLPGYEGLGGAMGDSLLGYGITINQDVAVMAANAKSILFGDFKRYTIRDVMGMTLFRFDDSAYVKLGQIGFLAWMRTGGTLTDGGAPIKHYANSAT